MAASAPVQDYFSSASPTPSCDFHNQKKCARKGFLFALLNSSAEFLCAFAGLINFFEKGASPSVD